MRILSDDKGAYLFTATACLRALLVAYLAPNALQLAFLGLCEGVVVGEDDPLLLAEPLLLLREDQRWVLAAISVGRRRG